MLNVQQVRFSTPHLHICLSVSLHACIFISLTLCLSVLSCVCLSGWLPSSSRCCSYLLYIRPSIHPYIHLSKNFSVSLLNIMRKILNSKAEISVEIFYSNICRRKMINFSNVLVFVNCVKPKSLLKLFLFWAMSNERIQVFEFIFPHIFHKIYFLPLNVFPTFSGNRKHIFPIFLNSFNKYGSATFCPQLPSIVKNDFILSNYKILQNVPTAFFVKVYFLFKLKTLYHTLNLIRSRISPNRNINGFKKIEFPVSRRTFYFS